MKTEHLKIHSPSPGDHQRLRNLRNACRESFFSDTPISPESHSRWYRQVIVDPTQRFWVAYEADSGELVGTVGLAQIDLVNSCCEYGRLLVDPNFAQRGYGSELLGLAVKVAFIGMELNSIYGYILERNTAGWQLAAKLGFNVDVVLLERVQKRGKFLNVRVAQLTAGRLGEGNTKESSHG